MLANHFHTKYGQEIPKLQILIRCLSPFSNMSVLKRSCLIILSIQAATEPARTQLGADEGGAAARPITKLVDRRRMRGAKPRPLLEEGAGEKAALRTFPDRVIFVKNAQKLLWCTSFWSRSSSEVIGGKLEWFCAQRTDLEAILTELHQRVHLAACICADTSQRGWKLTIFQS